MTDAQQREAARQFFYRWNGKGNEIQHARSFWIEILSDIFDVERVTERVEFEKPLTGADGNTKYIDVYIPETRVLIEQKTLGIALDKPQAGHNGQTPYEQAKYYDNYLPFEEKARWIIVSNFAEIWIYDMNQKVPQPVKIALADLQTKLHLLDFMVNRRVNKITEEVELSKAAGELVGKIRDRFLTQYNDPLAPWTQKSLNILCVRLVFCFYAEDAGLFGPKDAFSKYILQYKPGDIRGKLLELFRVLDTPVSGRADLYLDDEAASFPYVNGGLFSDENIIIPRLTQEIKDALAEAARFDWSKISPTIFGAVFESTLNPETRRKGGMHYTSIENIHKLIDPLFLNDLKNELKEIRNITVLATQKKRLTAYQDKIASLVFFDPACGSGNFLTETYLCLRRLENEVLRLKVAADSKLMDGQISFGFEENGPIKVSIHQFYGIEINDFACSVAQTALWIAESQTMKETEGIIHAPMDYFPLQTYRGITEGNALRIDWSKACPANRLSYIIGNPPFVANSGRVSAKEASVKAMMTNEQKEDKKRLFGSNAGTLDYVACWFKKAAQFMNGTGVRAAFVATNSICQGEQVAPLWKPLFDDGVKVNFAHRSFKWESEASQKATVFVVIVGFSYMESPKKELFDGDFCNEVKHINAYLVDADDVFLEKRKIPISINAKKMHRGSQPTDNGNFIFSRKEYEQFICDNPDAKPLFRKFMMGKDFIDRVPRYCLWLKKASPQDIKKYPEIRGRLNQIREYRMQSTKAATRKKAETPMLFDEDQQPDTAFVAIPEVSSGNRRYIPIDFMMPDTVVGNKIRILENAELYDFGVLTSNVHMAWMRTTCGYYGPSYQYSINIVYNNFPWPSPTEEQKQRIEQTAQGILDARNLYPDSSLADLYDPLTMPVELRKAHTANDKAVMQAYGMPIKETDEAACVAWLMRLYQEVTSK